MEKCNDIINVKLAEGARLPERAHVGDVGFDVRSISCEYNEERDSYVYHTGIYVESSSEDGLTTSLYLFPRSSNAKTDCYLTNSVGVVDSDIYRGEIMAVFKNRTSIDVMAHIETAKALLSYRGPEILDYEERFKLVKDDLIARARNLEFAPYNVGDKCAQLIYAKEVTPTYVEVDEIDENTSRGANGYGSTGK